MKATGARVSRKIQRATKVGVSNDPQWYSLTAEDMPHTKEAWLHFLKKVANRWEVTRAIERATSFEVSPSGKRATDSEASKCKKRATYLSVSPARERAVYTRVSIKSKRATGVSVSPTQEQAVCTLASLTQEQATRITASFTDQRADKQTTQPSAPKKAPLKKKADKSLASLKSKRANSFAVSGDIKRATHWRASTGKERATHKAVSSVRKCQEQRVDVFKQIQTMPLQELVSAIRIARDKAYDEQPLNSFEKFLFDKFLNHNGDIETLAQKLKGKR